MFSHHLPFGVRFAEPQTGPMVPPDVFGTIGRLRLILIPWTASETQVLLPRCMAGLISSGECSEGLLLWVSALLSPPCGCPGGRFDAWRCNQPGFDALGDARGIWECCFCAQQLGDPGSWGVLSFREEFGSTWPFGPHVWQLRKMMQLLIDFGADSTTLRAMRI